MPLRTLMMLAISALAAPSTALADPGDDAEAVPVTDETPEHRVDVILPSGGIALAAVGAHGGGNAGLSLDFRGRNFVVGLGAQYRVLLPSARALNGGDSGVEHALTATLALGGTLY